jgi:hypothetical protein
MFVAGAGCGGDPSPVEQCREFLDTICDRGSSCLPQLGSKDSCLAAIRELVSCDSAKEVTDAFDNCIDQLEDNSCSTLFPVDSSSGQPALVLPPSCRGVIKVGTVPELTSPGELSAVSGAAAL